MSSKSANVDVSRIAGNAPEDVKRKLLDTALFNHAQQAFANDIFNRLEFTEISIQPKMEEPGKMEARVVLETVVEPDMLNVVGTVHGACSAFLVDNCSTLALVVLNYVTIGKPAPGVSQALNMIYHSPAPLGAKLRIVNTTQAIGGRTMSAQTEIWNVTDQRLVASGTHIKIQPSKAGL